MRWAPAEARSQERWPQNDGIAWFPCVILCLQSLFNYESHLKKMKKAISVRAARVSPDVWVACVTLLAAFLCLLARTQKPRARRQRVVTENEDSAMKALAERFVGDQKVPQERLLQLAWSRGLNVDHAADLWLRHLSALKELKIREVSDEMVRRAYDAGFCVLSGVDWEQRPMIWVRLALAVPSTMTASQVVKNTWMAQDATLSTGIEANRRGICFVYDLKGIGFKNLNFDPMALHAVIRGALSHPCHISRVWLLDAPWIFFLAWEAFKHFIPDDVRKLVRFAQSGKRDSFSHVCPASQLPVYLGGPRSFSQAYCDWMFAQLEHQHLAYRAPTLHLPVPSRRSGQRTGHGTCHNGVKLLGPLITACGRQLCTRDSIKD